jgi:serine/threonine protein kinase
MGWTGFTNRFRAADTTRAVAGASGRVAVAPDRQSVLGRLALGKYELLQLIGEGSNGEVYLARPKAQPTAYVVVKRVKRHLLENPRFRQFFDGEVQSMRRFQHPYVVQLLDATLDDPIGPCMVLEYIHGVTLEAILQRYPRWYPERLARLFGQLCHALQAAHDAGIVHRDLKPANLMVAGFNTPQETLKVMDFGFAGFTERPHIQIAELTGCGPIFACGTPAYVSPEMVRADSVDGRADLYAAGVMLYEMLAGRLPFEYEKVEDILAAHVKTAPPRFGKIGVADVSAQVEGVVQMALAKYPNERHQSARELAEHYGRAIGVRVWEETAPAGWVPNPHSPSRTVDTVVECTLVEAPKGPPAEDPYTLSDTFDAMLPPRMAAAKLKGFVDDVGGAVLESEPGLIRMQVALPKGYQQPQSRSALLGWISAIRQPSVRRGEEPIEVAMWMRNLDPNRVEVKVAFQPLREYLPSDPTAWRERCEQLYNVLRMYLMASSG